MEKAKLLKKVERFEALRRENSKLKSWPAYRYEHTEEYAETVYTDFANTREEIINIFNIKGQKYNHGEGLDAQQIAERYITEEYVNKRFN
jgi:hypothetical protein